MQRKICKRSKHHPASLIQNKQTNSRGKARKKARMQEIEYSESQIYEYKTHKTIQFTFKQLFYHKKLHRRVKGALHPCFSRFLRDPQPQTTMPESTYNKSSHLSPSDILKVWIFCLEPSKSCSTAIAQGGLHNLKSTADIQKPYWFYLPLRYKKSDNKSRL